ncbi:hypothetical protein Pan216_30060 [Planctomycetes bacterium Pan216]|uniref:Uncharacterized protein n=1 Tax=Kolteria novifilia TaxID=2527975 RepID=A0A518B589_9BACT|nr:hypothetical protein Pan216_30060 [Planctomycetes bacterium Pan216]
MSPSKGLLDLARSLKLSVYHLLGWSHTPPLPHVPTMRGGPMDGKRLDPKMLPSAGMQVCATYVVYASGKTKRLSCYVLAADGDLYFAGVLQDINDAEETVQRELTLRN